MFSVGIEKKHWLEKGKSNEYAFFFISVFIPSPTSKLFMLNLELLSKHFLTISQSRNCIFFCRDTILAQEVICT